MRFGSLAAIGYGGKFELGPLASGGCSAAQAIRPHATDASRIARHDLVCFELRAIMFAREFLARRIIQIVGGAVA